MFDKNFYPTPVSVIEQMVAGFDLNGKIILEPSAGSGNIVDFCINEGANVIACEKHDDLRKIVESKCNVIGSDFLKISSEQISHIHMIIMNPPFSNDERHILHAWSIAPEGCEIISLFNYESFNNSYSSDRREFKALIENYGEANNLGDVFSSAERKTGVNIGLVKLFKPVVSKEFNWDGFFFTPDEDSPNTSGIIQYNEIRAIVNSYVAAVNCFDEVEAVSDKMSSLLRGIGSGVGSVGFKTGYSQDDTIYTKSDFAKMLQIKCWKNIFDRMNIGKYVTKGVMEDINKFVKSRSNYPFTMRNVYRMLEIIVGTSGETMKRAIVEAVDRFTKYTHENRFGVEGWKTNEGYLLNMKFISGWICESNYSGSLRIKDWNGNFEYLNDLTKALCFLTGTNYDSIPKIALSSADKDESGKFIPEGYSGRVQNEGCFVANKWYQWGFFEFKVYKKGTGHFKFIDEDVWGLLNQTYAKAKGQVLPEFIKPVKTKKAA